MSIVYKNSGRVSSLNDFPVIRKLDPCMAGLKKITINIHPVTLIHRMNNETDIILYTS